MSNSRIFQASYPAERLRGCKFATDFRDPLAMARDGWTSFGSPLYHPDGGAILNGTSQYLTRTLTGELNSANLTFHLEFYPAFAADDGIYHIFFDTPSVGGRWFVGKTATNTLIVFGGAAGATIIQVVLANFQSYWVVGGRNLISVSLTSGVNSIYLNGNLVGTSATAWTQTDRPTIYVGASNSAGLMAGGVYKRLYVGHHTSTLAEHLAYWNGTMWNWRNRATCVLQLRTADYDPSNVRTLDSSGHGNHFTLGDGVTPTTFPTQQAGKMYFDGGDYLDGGDDADLDFVSAGSLLCCFNLTAYTNYVWLMGKEVYNTGRSGYALYVHNVGAQVRGQVCSAAASQTTALAGPSVQYGMHTAAFAWDGSNIYLFVDGVLLNTTVQVVTPAPSGQRARVGRPSDSASYMLTGTVFDSKWANFAINPTQCADYHHKMRSVIGSEL